MNTIKNIDGICCKAGSELKKSIAPCLQYEYSYWRQRMWNMSKERKTRYFIDQRSGKFLAGFLPRVERYCQVSNIPYSIEGEIEKLIHTKKPAVKGLTLRKDQIDLCYLAAKKQRGVIKSPTGSGKTVIIMGIIGMYPGKRVLVLCHTKDIILQTYDEFKEKGLKDLQVIMGGKSKELKGQIILSTIQSFSKISPSIYFDAFDIVFYDECHHVNSTKSLYGKFAIGNLSPIKLGFTATIPKKKKEQLALEGLIGPIIGELSIQEGIDLKILAKPKITLISVPVRPSILDKRNWRDIYLYGIVENRLRNTAIVKAVSERIKKKQTVLVMVKEIEHGNILVELGKKMKVKFKFVQGSTDNKTRMDTKNALNDKKERAVISTAIWREGINIPSLDCVVNAIGGKSEIQTLQNIGRGLRVTDDKKEVEIIDFLDPYRYVAEHSVRRLQVYVDNGWL